MMKLVIHGIRSITLTVSSEYTIQHMRLMFEQSYQPSVIEQDYRLFFEEKILNDNDLISQTPLQNNSEIWFLPQDSYQQKQLDIFPIFIEDPEGKRTRLYVEPSTTIGKLMDVIFCITGDHPDTLRLFFNLERMVLGKSLSDYNVQKDDTIYQVLEIYGC